MADLRKLYTVWPANSKFICFGRCMTGPCLSGSMFVWLLVLVPVAVFCILVLPRTWELQPVLAIIAIVLFASMIGLLLATSCSEPGVIPKRAVIQTMGIGEEISEILGYNVLGMSEPTRDCLVDAKEMLTEDLQKKGYNWCRTCEIVRPPRASHCRSCDHCVLRFDHHCPFVNNCIAKRNYFYFVGFLMSILCSTLFGLSVVLWWSVNQANEFNFALRYRELIHIGRSLENSKCVSHLTPVECDLDAGGKAKRLNAYRADDAFNITTHGTQVCAQRIDLSTGWEMDLQIACKKVAQEVLVVSARSSEDSVIFGASWMVAAVSSVVLLFLFYHLYLAYYGMTSKEQQTSKPTHTDLLVKKVKKSTLFTSRGPSLFDPHALVRVDVLTEAFKLATEMRKVVVAEKAAAAKKQREEEEELMADPEKAASLKDRRPAEADRLLRLKRRRAHAEKLQKQARQDQCCLTKPRSLTQGVKNKFRRLRYSFDKGWWLPRCCKGADQAIVHIEV